MDTGLKGKTVIVTGGNNNIGRGISLSFAREGARVVAAARDEEAGARTVTAALEAGADEAVFEPVDLLDPRSAEALVERVLGRFGTVDVLVNNVGGNVAMDPFWEMEPETWQAELDLNLTTMFTVTKAALRPMIEQRAGRIVNIGSTAGITGDLWLAVYSATKGGMHAFTRVLAKEVGPYGITVNAVAPRGTRADDLAEETSAGSRWNPDDGITALMQRRAEEAEESLGREPRRDKTVLGSARGRQFLRLHEVADAAVFLASDSSAFTTGSILVVDGGLTLA